MPGPLTLVVQPDPEAPSARLGEWLAEAGLELDVRDLAASDPLPPDLSGHRALIVLGGGEGVGDVPPPRWLDGVCELIRGAVAAEVPLLGVCLGAQVMAVALGGSVGRNPDGPEIGAGLVAKRAVASSDPLFGELPITPDVVQWHVDAVTRLPPGAQLLASSPACSVQAFRAGRLAWGVQFHIETTPAIVRAWARADAHLLTAYDVDAVLRQVEAIDADLVEVWRPFAVRFADVVTDPASVRPPRGVATTTAEPITDPGAIRAALAAELAASRAPGPHPLPQPSVRATDPEPRE
jgi:GMP synthase-like glutamine amidotransferase